MHSHGRSQGVPVYTRGRVEKNFFGRGNLQGKVESATPRQSKKFEFLQTFLLGGGDLEGGSG